MKTYKLDILKWIATIITLLGAICVSLSIDPLNVILMNLGAFLFLIWSYLIREKALICVNGGLLAVYLFGFILRIN